MLFSFDVLYRRSNLAHKKLTAVRNKDSGHPRWERDGYWLGEGRREFLWPGAALIHYQRVSCIKYSVCKNSSSWTFYYTHCMILQF